MSHNAFPALMGRLCAGDQRAAAYVFRRFAPLLLELAARRLDRRLRPKEGPEDIVQAAFAGFFARLRRGPLDLRGWGDLWGVLVVITVRECGKRAAYFRAARRDVRREARGPVEGRGAAWEALATGPTPAEEAELAETTRWVLGRFRGPERAIAELSLQGRPAPEISARAGCSLRKAYRVLARVRDELRRLQTGGADEAVA
jgi:DNA-directed RNA polymerase specialized sigma24 family protein